MSDDELKRLRTCVEIICDVDEGGDFWKDIGRMSVEELCQLIEKNDELESNFIDSILETKRLAEEDAARFQWLAANSVGVDIGIGWSGGNKIETIRSLVDSKRNLEPKILHSPEQTIHIITKDALSTGPLR